MCQAEGFLAILRRYYLFVCSIELWLTVDVFYYAALKTAKQKQTIKGAPSDFHLPGELPTLRHGAASTDP
jgi:hypothetical protein